MRKKLLWALPVGVVAMLAVPQLALADIAGSRENGVFTESDCDQHDVGDDRRLPRDVHAGRVPAAGDRILAREERWNAGAEGPDQLLDRSPRLLGGAGSRSRSGATLRAATHSSATPGSSCRTSGTLGEAFPVMGLSNATVEAKWFFQFTFCAVSLAIVWGTTLERIKFGVYIIYAIMFARSSTRSAPTGCSAAAGCSRTSACRTSPARRRSTSSVRPAAWPCCCCWGPARASTAGTASRDRSLGTTCPCSASGC